MTQRPRWFGLLLLLALGGSAVFLAWQTKMALSLVSTSSEDGRANGIFGRVPDQPAQFAAERFSGAPHPLTFDTASASSPSDPTLTPPGFPADSQFLPAGGKLEFALHTTTPGADIRYTTNGGPVGLDSPPYAGPITLARTAMVRARVFVAGRASEESSRTYFFGVEHRLPIVSLAAPPSNFDFKDGYLFGMGDRAIGPRGEVLNSFPYFGANAWQDREIEVAMEFFDTDRQSKLRQRAGLRVFGGWGSRCYPQKSLALAARHRYGKGKFHYRFFPDRDIDRFESLLLRNSGNDNQSTHQLAPRPPITEFGPTKNYGAYFVNGNFTLLRDAMEQRLLDGTGLATQASRPVVVYINGEYWGLYGLREKITQDYIHSHYGYEKGQFDLIVGWGSVLGGSADAYFAMQHMMANADLRAPANYAKVASQYLDIDNFIDYHLAIIYFQNFDIGNIKCWRPHSGDGRFRWIVYDQDCGFGLWPPEVYLPAMARDYADYRNMFDFCTATRLSGMGWPNAEGRTLLLRGMLLNEEFKQRFVQRCADLLNTQFREARVAGIIESMAAEVRPEIPRHLQRWSWPELQKRGFGPPFQPEHAPFVQGTWEANVARLAHFARHRPAQLRQDCAEHFKLSKGLATVEIKVVPEGAGRVQINTAVLRDFPWSGTLFRDYPVALTADAKPGYRFAAWSGPVGKHPKPRWTVGLNAAQNTFTARFEAAPPSVPDHPPVILDSAP
jgi:hypothetical protein